MINFVEWSMTLARAWACANRNTCATSALRHPFLPKEEDLASWVLRPPFLHGKPPAIAVGVRGAALEGSGEGIMGGSWSGDDDGNMRVHIKKDHVPSNNGNLWVALPTLIARKRRGVSMSCFHTCPRM
jgi:hypothetical protein